MDRQQIFNKVAKHLLTQNAQAVEYDGTEKRCVLLARDGKQCAFGCLIPKEKYKPYMELRGAISHWSQDQIEDVLGEPVTEGDIEFLIKLQKIHDCFQPDTWKYHLTNFANLWGLKTNVLS